MDEQQKNRKSPNQVEYGNSLEETPSVLKPGLEVSPFASDEFAIIGKDPRSISKEEWINLKSEFPIGLNAIRQKCLDCNGSVSEVRKCPCVECDLWPFRMGSIPKGYRAARAIGGCDAVQS